ncbi:hypothetical protein TW74_02760 [Vibrio nigripulchritudo]|nr:hypothetical protein TW74_02760 [Vibrio nigripulchritudo]
MLCKITLVISTALFALSASALSFENYLKSQMKLKYDSLNLKVEECLKVRREHFELDDFNNAWFNNLSNKDKRRVIIMVKQISDERCYSDELKAYSDIVVQYTANTGDKTALNAYLNIRRHLPKEEAEMLSHLDFDQIQKLSTESPFDKPFDAMKAIRLFW